MAEFEERGIPTLETPPSVLTQQYTSYRNAILIDQIQSAVEAAIERAASSTTARSTESALLDGLLKVRALSVELRESGSVASLPN